MLACVLRIVKLWNVQGAIPILFCFDFWIFEEANGDQFIVGRVIVFRGRHHHLNIISGSAGSDSQRSWTEGSEMRRGRRERKKPVYPSLQFPGRSMDDVSAKTNELSLVVLLLLLVVLSDGDDMGVVLLATEWQQPSPHPSDTAL